MDSPGGSRHSKVDDKEIYLAFETLTDIDFETDALSSPSEMSDFLAPGLAKSTT